MSYHNVVLNNDGSIFIEGNHLLCAKYDEKVELRQILNVGILAEVIITRICYIKLEHELLPLYASRNPYCLFFFYNKYTYRILESMEKPYEVLFNELSS